MPTNLVTLTLDQFHIHRNMATIAILLNTLRVNVLSRNVIHPIISILCYNQQYKIIINIEISI